MVSLRFWAFFTDLLVLVLLIFLMFSAVAQYTSDFFLFLDMVFLAIPCIGLIRIKSQIQNDSYLSF